MAKTIIRRKIDRDYSKPTKVTLRDRGTSEEFKPTIPDHSLEAYEQSFLDQGVKLRARKTNKDPKQRGATYDKCTPVTDHRCMGNSYHTHSPIALQGTEATVTTALETLRRDLGEVQEKLKDKMAEAELLGVPVPNYPIRHPSRWHNTEAIEEEILRIKTCKGTFGFDFDGILLTLTKAVARAKAAKTRERNKKLKEDIETTITQENEMGRELPGYRWFLTPFIKRGAIDSLNSNLKGITEVVAGLVKGPGEYGFIKVKVAEVEDTKGIPTSQLQRDSWGRYFVTTKETRDIVHSLVGSVNFKKTIKEKEIEGVSTSIYQILWRPEDFGLKSR